MLEAGKFKLTEQQAVLRGITDTMTVYQIP